jgi:hypothetical protein
MLPEGQRLRLLDFFSCRIKTEVVTTTVEKSLGRQNNQKTRLAQTHTHRFYGHCFLFVVFLFDARDAICLLNLATASQVHKQAKPKN